MTPFLRRSQNIFSYNIFQKKILSYKKRNIYTKEGDQYQLSTRYTKLKIMCMC